MKKCFDLGGTSGQRCQGGLATRVKKASTLCFTVGGDTSKATRGFPLTDPWGGQKTTLLRNNLAVVTSGGAGLRQDVRTRRVGKGVEVCAGGRINGEVGRNGTDPPGRTNGEKHCFLVQRRHA